jgi:excinuclease ABC subunit C
MEPRPEIREKLELLPTRPGVYIYRDARGTIIYVGKAVNLRNRVRSYFHASAELTPKTLRLVSEIADLEIWPTDTELEALLLECNLIKKHKPKFNVRLKDDKRYPYIRVNWQDPFPKVLTTRQMEQDGARYFGPFTNSSAVYQTLDMLRKAFPYLTCDREITGHDKRACLYYDIKLCSAPCIGAVSQDEYRATIDQLCQFLEGKTNGIETDLQRKMEAASEAMEFERAAQYRDQIKAIRHIVERQKIVSTTTQDQDVIAFARDESRGDACVQVFFIRQGKLIGREYFVLEGAQDEDAREIMSGFLKQFYEEAATIPPEVLIQVEVEESNIIEQWLKQKRGATVRLDVPKEGPPCELLAMAAESAAETLAVLEAQWQADEHKHEEALQQLAEVLNLTAPPARIECFDISNTQGTAIVGSMVVFVKGVPKKSDYRKFNIKSVQGAPDDFASMKEVLTRRFRRYLDSKQTSEVSQTSEVLSKLPGKKQDASFAMLPDLLIVDGGKGQLGVAVEVLKDDGLFEVVPVVGLAKQQEELFQPGRAQSILLPRKSQGLYLVQRVRDEAHRFAITAHRTQRAKIGLASQLDAIPGIGPARRRQLLKRFGSLDGIRAASVEELATVVPLAVAQAVKAAL